MMPRIGWVLLFLFTSLHLSAQTQSDLDFAKKKQPRVTSHTIVYANYKGAGKIMVFTYLLYKRFISSQDVFRCSFYPTCANYSISAIAELGFVTGALISFDRVTRCNHGKSSLYEWHFPSESMYDPLPISTSQSP